MRRRSFNILISIILLMPVLSGCLEDIEEVELEIDENTLEAPGNLTATVSDGTVLLSWSPVTGAVSYNIYRSAGSGSMSLAANVGDTDYLDQDVRNGQIYTYTVAAVAQGGIVGHRTDEIYAMPSIYSIIINGGVGYTESGIVLLSLTAPATTVLMKISNDPGMASASWEVYSSTKEWDIGWGDGVKTVHAVFQDENGSESPVVSGSITLDTYSGISDVTVLPDLDRYALGATVRFTVSTVGAERGGEAWIELQGYSESVELRDDGIGGDVTADDGVYEAGFTFPESYRGIDLGIAGMFVDRAGNSAPATESSKKLSFTDPPDPVSMVSAIDSSTSSITIKWVESQEDHFLAYRIYRSTNPDVEETDGNFIRGLDNRSQTSYPDGSLMEGQTYYYRIAVVNDLEETALSPNELEASTFDAYPTAVVLDPPSSVDVNRVTLTWSQNSNSDFNEYRIYRSTSPGVLETSQLLVIIDDRELTWYDDADGLDTVTNTYYYRVFVYDKGMKFTRSNEVSTD